MKKYRKAIRYIDHSDKGFQDTDSDDDEGEKPENEEKKKKREETEAAFDKILLPCLLNR